MKDSTKEAMKESIKESIKELYTRMNKGIKGRNQRKESKEGVKGS